MGQEKKPTRKWRNGKSCGSLIGDAGADVPAARALINHREAALAADDAHQTASAGLKLKGRPVGTAVVAEAVQPEKRR